MYRCFEVNDLYLATVLGSVCSAYGSIVVIMNRNHESCIVVVVWQAVSILGLSGFFFYGLHKQATALVCAVLVGFGCYSSFEKSRMLQQLVSMPIII